MKRVFSALFILVMTLSLVGCSGKSDPLAGLSKEGVAPYEYSENEQKLLQSFGMKGNSQILSFKAPVEATALNVNVYRLDDNGSWADIGSGGIYIDDDEQTVETLSGSVTLQLKDNYSIAFNINYGGQAAYKTEEIVLDSSVMASAIGFLQEFQSIELNKEIPVVIMVYDGGTSMKNFELQDYFEPARFEGMDLVQMVTLEFADK